MLSAMLLAFWTKSSPKSHGPLSIREGAPELRSLFRCFRTAFQHSTLECETALPIRVTENLMADSISFRPNSSSFARDSWRDRSDPKVSIENHCRWLRSLSSLCVVSGTITTILSSSLGRHGHIQMEGETAPRIVCA